MREPESLVLFDGVCRLCHGSVRFLSARDPAGRFGYVPIQTEQGRALCARFGIDADNPDSFALIDGHRQWQQSAAWVRVLARLPGLWPWLAALLWLVPAPFRDLAYRVVGTRRYRWFGRHAQCELPAGDAATRIVEPGGVDAFLAARNEPAPRHPAQGTGVLAAWLIAMAAIWHYTSSSNEIWNFWLHFDPVQTPAVIAALVSALLAACFPANPRVFIGFATVQLCVIGIRLPFVPTHVVMQAFLFGGVLLAAFTRHLDGRAPLSMGRLFSAYAPVGRWLLLAMYFFGTFHKLNPGFMSPASSCALPFAAGLPVPQALLDWVPFQYAAITGTLVLEAVAFALLLFRRTKYWGMAIGVPFHLAIGVSDYGTLAHFSGLALALHVLFAPADFGDRVRRDARVPSWLWSRSAAQLLAVGILLLQLGFALSASWAAMNLLFGSFGLICYLLILRNADQPGAGERLLLARPLALNLWPALFVFHAAGPYLGGSTAAAVEMFSGLRTEGGVSNHYLVRRPLDLLPYQRPVVHVEHSRDEFLGWLQREGLGLVLFDFQRFLTTKEHPLPLPLIVRVGEQRHVLDSGPALQAFAARYFEPQGVLERKLLAFRKVDALQPARCRH